SNRSYIFASAGDPMTPNLPNVRRVDILGDEVVQVVICIYGQKIAKKANYAKVMAALQGGENAVDYSGAPNQAQSDPVI
ncbi:hypothetical protein HDU78_000272, partial [Chytriomyces hyalinus]